MYGRVINIYAVSLQYIRRVVVTNASSVPKNSDTGSDVLAGMHNSDAENYWDATPILDKHFATRIRI